MPVLFGEFDKNIRLIESELTVQIISREGVFKIIGEEENAEKAFEVLTNLETVAENSDELTEQDIRYAVAMAQDGIKYGAWRQLCLHNGFGKTDSRKNRRSEKVYRTYTRKHGCFRDRACRNGQDVSGCRNGGRRVQKKTGKQNSFDKTCR